MAERLTCGLWGCFFRTRLLSLALVLVCFLALPGPAWAQFTQSVPSPSYFQSFQTYWDGDYREALKDFQDEGRGGIKAETNRWIDSICYYTMIGECYYQMGQHQQALVQYTNALQLYYAFSNWMVRVQFPPGINPANNNEFKPVPWGRSARAFVLGHYPDTMPIGQGQVLTTQQQLSQNGPVPTPLLYPIHVQEIVRCTTLSMRRRRELMGPACAQDELTNDLITALSRRPGIPNHWSECWIDVQLGVAYACGGKDVQAKGMLERSLLAAGQFDHPLTGMAFLELGRLSLVAGDYETASNYFAEASYSAAFYMDPVVVEEALRFGQLTHLLANRPGLFPPLSAATMWAKANNLRQLNVSTQLLAAENCCILGETQSANNLLASAANTMGRRAMIAGKIGARFNFISALAAYQQANITAGDRFLSSALSFQRTGSLRLFQIALSDTMYTGGSVTARVAMDLYNEVLRDPTPADWAMDPLESLSVMVVPHIPSYEHWFDVAVQRKDHERLLEISDLTRRHRFLSTFEFGGRIHNLRWLLDGPEDILDQESKLQRQDILNRYSQYDKFRQEAHKLRDELKQAPLYSPDQREQHVQSERLAKLAEVSKSQELLLREIAVRREPSKIVFPPYRTTKEIKAALPAGHALLSFFSTQQQQYAILLTHDKYGYWKVPRNEQLARPIVKLLQGLGSVDPNREVTLKDLQSESWKDTAKQVFESLTKDSRADFKKFTQLVIVPDGMLWYLPFEALSIKEDDRLVPLGSKIQVRYAPLASLGVADARPRRAPGQTAVVVGKLMQSGSAETAQNAFDELSKVMPGLVALRPPLPHDVATYSSLFDGLIVLNEVPFSDDGPFEWSPLPNDAKSSAALENWFDLPWGGPEFVILPSFHTAAERAMKKQASEPGNEIFLSVCGLMANGARTILLSRWRTGGQTSVDLVREFMQELQHTTAAEAWQRGVFVVSENTLNPAAEPRLRLAAKEEAPKASHPFFWAGYMLVDTGAVTQAMADEMPIKKPEAVGAAALNKQEQKPVGFNAPNQAGGLNMPPEPPNGAPPAAAGGLQGPPMIGDQPEQPPAADEPRRRGQRKASGKKAEQEGAALEFGGENPGAGEAGAADGQPANRRGATKGSAAKNRAAKGGVKNAAGAPAAQTDSPPAPVPPPAKKGPPTPVPPPAKEEPKKTAPASGPPAPVPPPANP